MKDEILLKNVSTFARGAGIHEDVLNVHTELCRNPHTRFSTFFSVPQQTHRTPNTHTQTEKDRERQRKKTREDETRREKMKIKRREERR